MADEQQVMTAAMPDAVAGIEAVAAVLDDDPQSENAVLELIARRLEAGAEPTTWAGISDALRTYFGDSGLSALTALVAAVDHWAALHELDPYVSPRVRAFLRRLLSAHGLQLRDAYDRSAQHPDDWSFVNREIHHDLVTGRYEMRIRIEKASNEVVRLEGSVDSILNLLRFIVATMRWVPTPDAFATAVVEAFLAEAEPFLGFLKGQGGGDGAGANGSPPEPAEGDVTVD
jgi:hypothetical protein